MERMTEAEAIEAGLTTLIDLAGPAVETPAETADRAARNADELAAMVERVRACGDGGELAMVSDGLGALHVEFDMLAEHLRQGARVHGARGAA